MYPNEPNECDTAARNLIVFSPLWLLHVSLSIKYYNLVLDWDNNFYLISLSILVICLLDNVRMLEG